MRRSAVLSLDRGLLLRPGHLVRPGGLGRTAQPRRAKGIGGGWWAGDDGAASRADRVIPKLLPRGLPVGFQSGELIRDLFLPGGDPLVADVDRAGAGHTGPTGVGPRVLPARDRDRGGGWKSRPASTSTVTIRRELVPARGSWITT